MKRALLIFLIAGVLMFSAGGKAMAEVKEFTIPVISDFSGAYAELFKSWVPIQKAVFAWWNDTEGAKLGVKLNLKHYDGRYDSSVVASMWPGILAETEPIAALGAGGADVAALQQRLPKDKVPVFYGTAAYGYAWQPDQWIFHVRPTYLHEMLTALEFYAKQNPDKRPIKVGFLIGNVAAAVDLFKGMDKYVSEVLEPKGLVKVVAREYVEINPVDISTQVKKLIDAKSDMILAPITTAMTTAYVKACQLYDVNIPTIASPHHTIWPFGRAMKTYEPFEGHLVAAGHVAVTRESGDGYKFFELLCDKYKLPKKLWNPYSMMALNQSLLAVRAIENGIKKAGKDKVDGMAVYEAMFENPITSEQLMGTMPTLTFTKNAPFPLGEGVKVMVETVKDGKYTVATDEWLQIPMDLKPWSKKKE